MKRNTTHANPFRQLYVARKSLTVFAARGACKWGCICKWVAANPPLPLQRQLQRQLQAPHAKQLTLQKALSEGIMAEAQGNPPHYVSPALVTASHTCLDKARHGQHCALEQSIFCQLDAPQRGGPPTSTDRSTHPQMRVAREDASPQVTCGAHLPRSRSLSFSASIFARIASSLSGPTCCAACASLGSVSSLKPSCARCF